MNIKDTYNRIAADWHKDHSNDDWWIPGTDTFVSLLPVNAAVLDVGCAGGYKTKYLVEKGCRVHGTDISEEFIKIAEAEVPEATFSVADMRDLSHINETFDGVFVQASLLHIEKKDVDAVLRSLVEKLHDGGVLYVAVKKLRERNPEEQIVKEDDYGYEYERFFSYFTMDELKERFAKAGLTIVFENVETVASTDWLELMGRR